MTKKLTPMQVQHQRLKAEAGDALLLFRLGDFYELFDDDAVIASKALGLTLTARGKGTENETPMCGMPYHSADSYIEKLSLAGYKIAICEQIPSTDGKMMDREIVQYITPGTKLAGHVSEGEILTLVAISCVHQEYGICFLDSTTGETLVTTCASIDAVKDELARRHIDEIVVSPDFFDRDVFSQEVLTSFTPSVQDHASYVQKIFNASLKVLFLEKAERIEAVSLACQYAAYTKPQTDFVFSVPYQYDTGEFMSIDARTRKHLELFAVERDGSYEGSLLWAINKTLTPMGARQLQKWMYYPLRHAKDIEQRLSLVEKCIENSDTTNTIRETLKYVRDIERIAGKISAKTANPRDLLVLKTSLEYIQKIQSHINTIFQ